MPVAPMLKAYLDTCAVSRLVDERGDRHERLALDELLSLHNQGVIELVRSDHVEDEIEKIPAQYRGPYGKMLDKFLFLPTVRMVAKTRLGSCGFGVASRDSMWFARLAVLSDEKDRWHVFTARRNNIKHLVTLDKEILSKRELIGVRLMPPSAFLALVQPSEAA